MSDAQSGPERVAVVIRRADAADAELLAALGATTFEETFAADNSPDDFAAYLAANFTPAQLNIDLADQANRFFIAELVGREAGYAKLRWGGDPATHEASQPVELSRIYAARQWLGRGVGQALMERCIDEARSGGGDMLWLGVWERNHRAIAFYERWGFVKVGEHDFMVGSDRQRDWVMALQL